MDWPTSTTQLTALVLFAFVTLDIIRRALCGRTVRKEYPLPPGPTPLPLLGSALSIDAQQPWLTFTDWRKKYGDIMYIRLLDTDAIILNSTSVASELLERRSRIYSDRPFITTAVPYGHDCDFALSRYGEHWRLCRRIFQQTFRADAALGFREMQLRRARRLVVNLIDAPDQYPFHFSTFSAAVAMSAVYDYEPSPRNDPIVSFADNFLRASLPGMGFGRAMLVKAFPFLLCVPDWLPGSGIKREAKEARTWRDKVVEVPFQYVQERMESEDPMNISMVSDHINRMEKFDGSYRSEYETALKHAAVTAFLGSVETTSSTLMTFALAMVENPHAWQRAQTEIDTIVGTDRLPEFEDRPSLPYIDAIIREVLRWRPVAPIVSHASMHSDIYEGYYIPKEATILVNVWAVSRDEARYPDGEKFIPERFLTADGMLTDDDPAEFIFGFGRRRCPGRHVADASLWSAIATMLATLDFNLAQDANGDDITFKATFASGLTVHPNPFPCRLTPRLHVKKNLLDRVLALK